MRKHGAEGRLSDAAFTGEYEYLVLYGREARGNDGYVGIGALGRRGAYRLVGTSCTRIRLTGCERFRTGAVFCRDSVSSLFSQSRSIMPEGWRGKRTWLGRNELWRSLERCFEIDLYGLF